MSIKSDKWIRRMAEEHGMIEPFESGQVRTEGDQRLISYGTSSYGYDVRCQGQFKVFTNINSATVDPKACDDRSFVDVEGDVCVIPPNSFALASTVAASRAACPSVVIMSGLMSFMSRSCCLAKPYRPDAPVLPAQGSPGSRQCQPSACPGSHPHSVA